MKIDYQHKEIQINGREKLADIFYAADQLQLDEEEWLVCVMNWEKMNPHIPTIVYTPALDWLDRPDMRPTPVIEFLVNDI